MWQKTKNFYHLCIAVLANTYYLFPARKLYIVGVTGTDGKTTTTSLIYHILKNTGRQVSLISTVAAYIGEKTYDTGFHVTNPSAMPLQKFLKTITQLGTGKNNNYLILEVTSHGIDQNRIWGIPFAVGVVTNITHEHLDYHKTYDLYLQTKAKLLRRARIAILNKDDASYGKLIDLIDNKKTRTYSITQDADITPKKFPFLSKMPGSFQEYNELAAISACIALGLTPEEIKSGLISFELPKGRFEKVYVGNFVVMVDFAHTPNAFEQLLKTLRPQVQGKIIHVFGAAGLRDNTKRSLMGEASAKYADVIILTSEDPRTESVDAINTQIKQGIVSLHRRDLEIIEIPNRKQAIEKAVAMAQEGDLVISTGKAHEQSMNYGYGEEPWDEFVVAKDALKKRGMDI